MPNMFGGDQFHPAYDPRQELGDNQVLIGNVVWSARPDGSAYWEDVDGSGGVGPMPQELKDKLAKRGKKP